MSSNMHNEEHDPVANLTMQPARSILKSSRSIDEGRFDEHHPANLAVDSYPITGMTRSESKSHKIPHFDEMNIIATYHPFNKDYGHMKIEEPKTPYAAGDLIDEEMDMEPGGDEATGVDPDALAERLNHPLSLSSQSHIHRTTRGSIDETSEGSKHRQQFESHRKHHYNEFEVVRLRKKEIEDELRALEQEEAAASESDERGNGTGIFPSKGAVKSILVHHDSENSSMLSSSPTTTQSQHHVHVEDDHRHDADDLSLSQEERERKKQFELKRKKHYNEFRVTHSADKTDNN